MSLEDHLYPWLNWYERMPDSLRQSLGKAWRLVPRRWRLGATYQKFRRLLEESREWGEADLREYQIRQLRRSLVHASNFCPYYQRAFARAKFRPETVTDIEDLGGCPYLTKGDVQRHLTELVSREVPEHRRLYLTTGGSTGVPVGFYLHKGVSRPKEQAFLEAMWRRAGYTDRSRLAVIRGHVTDQRAGGRIARHDPTRDWLMLSSYHLTAERLPDYLDAIERFRPDILHAYPSAALLLAEYLEASGQTWRTPLTAVLCGSERLTLPQKRVLERVFGCRVYRWYGHSERVVLAGEGERTENFYFFPQYGLVEFGPPDEDGLCEVIGTSFDNLAMPMIRYRTGDYVRLVGGGEEWEYPWPAVADIAGRGQEFLVALGGRKISLTAVNMHDAIFDDLYAVQFYQESPGRAEFRYVPAPGFQASRLEAIRVGLQRKLGDEFKLVFRQVQETEKTERGKHRWLVSRLGSSASTERA